MVSWLAHSLASGMQAACSHRATSLSGGLRLNLGCWLGASPEAWVCLEPSVYGEVVLAAFCGTWEAPEPERGGHSAFKV